LTNLKLLAIIEFEKGEVKTAWQGAVKKYPCNSTFSFCWELRLGSSLKIKGEGKSGSLNCLPNSDK
jgi:hypothetical protein